MASVSTYLNFKNQTEEAFNFYKSVFGTEFLGEVNRFSGMPPMEGMPSLPESEKNLILHIALPISGGHLLMGSDAPESMGFKVNYGNNMHINIMTDSRAETEKLFYALSAGGTVEMELQDTFWGAYYASFKDKFGVHWMLNFDERQ